MAIKDEMEVARLLTSVEKHRNDQRRYKINPERGDRLVYRHFNKPEFALGPVRVRFRIKSRQWMLKLVARAKFLRKLVPGWHRKERRFRNWYIGLLREFRPDRAEAYEEFVRIFRCPEEVTGYGEVRYPKMAAARKRVDSILAELKKDERVLSKESSASA